MSSIWEEFNGGLASVAENAKQSLVQVISGRRGAGAGIIWNSAGLIITNAHVVRRHTPKVMLTDGRTFEATLLGLDKRNDLAALSVEASGLQAVTVGDSRALRSGEVVVALGHPWGINNSATAGIVVAASTGIPDRPDRGRELLSVSLHLRPGYSGGPVMDARGRVVGVNVMMAGPDVGLAIPAHVVENFLVAHGKQQRQNLPQVDPVPVT